MKRSIILLLLILPTIAGIGQLSNTWYFGYESGLDFDPSPGTSIPAVLTDGKMTADEGCSSISDSTGRLLFYTNGTKIYNRQHQIMSNGDGLMGHTSALQSSIIVPWPGNDSLYYVFTTDAYENNYANGYRYSIINMKLQNGMGEVVLKNSLLNTDASERMTAARHANGTDVWLITNSRNTNLFKAWLIDCDGLAASPVVSTIGEVLNDHAFQSIGSLKVSPDGKQLCQTHFPELGAQDPLTNFFQLFDFNNALGIITNPRKIQVNDKSYFTCEYSPNSQFVYLASPRDSSIYQFEATLPMVNDIAASIYRIFLTHQVYGLQLAPDRKIYAAGFGQYLDVINRPDLKGVNCDIGIRQIFLKNKSSRLQLPSIINDLAVNAHTFFDHEILDTCSGTVKFSAYTSLQGNLSWNWDFGDGNFSTLQNPIHTFHPFNASYSVTLIIASTESCSRPLRISKFISPSGIDTRTSFAAEVKCDSGIVRFRNLSAGSAITGAHFTWSFGDGQTSNEVSPVHAYAAPGIYEVKLKFTGGPDCLDDSTLQQVHITSYPINASLDQTVYLGQPVRLTVEATDALIYEWSPSTWLDNSSTASPVAIPLNDITYSVKVTNRAGCIGKDSVRITVRPVNGVYIPSAFSPNKDGLNETIYPVFPAGWRQKSFVIYNRWGQKLFTAQQRGMGWDGRYSGLPQGSGVYVYLLELTDDAGKPVFYRGTFTLLR